MPRGNQNRAIRWPLLHTAILLLSGCTGEVLGTIPPPQFHFRTVVELREGDRGGWKAAQVVISLGSRHGIAVCKIEVGVPVANERGWVSDRLAQTCAAEAADLAARAALANPRATAVSATVCRAFIDEMDRVLRDQIPGARVSGFVTEGLTPTSWP